MKYIFLIIGLMGILAFPAEAKERATVISAEIYGYVRDKVYFNFLEEEGINMEFPYKEGQVMECTVDLDDVTTLVLNTFIEIYLQPGDSVHVKVIYDGTRYKSVEFSGTPAAVAICSAINKKEMLQRERRYKTNIPAMLVTQTDAKKFHAATVKEIKDEVEIISQVKDQVDPRVYNMAMAQIEGTLLTNLITYPYASADFHKKKLEDCLAEDYWTALDNYKLRTDEASLRNQVYMAFLLPYKDYMRRKEAHDQGKDYQPLTSLEDEYKDMATFYKGALQDAALFVLLYNSITSNGDFNVIEKLVKDYLKKYNKNKEYKKILNQVMQ